LCLRHAADEPSGIVGEVGDEHTGGPPAVQGRRGGVEVAVTHGPEKVRLRLDGGGSRTSVGQVEKRTDPAADVGESQKDGAMTRPDEKSAPVMWKPCGYRSSGLAARGCCGGLRRWWSARDPSAGPSCSRCRLASAVVVEGTRQARVLARLEWFPLVTLGRLSRAAALLAEFPVEEVSETACHVIDGRVSTVDQVVGSNAVGQAVSRADEPVDINGLRVDAELR